MKRVSIITVNYNQPDVTRELLFSIAQTNTYKNIEIIVVDNGSKQNLNAELSGQFSNVSFIRSAINLGFAGGNNLGIQAATGDYYFLVNNDTEFTPGLVQKLVDVMEGHPDVGMVSPRINYFEDKTLIQYAGYTPMNYFTCRNRTIGQYQRNGADFAHISGPTGFAHGAAMMISREAANKAGLMYENYFLYYEEVDWGERVKRAGYQIWIQGGALIYHKESVSVGKNSWLKEYFMNRNRILFTRRNAPFFAALVFYAYFTAMVLPRNIINYVRGGNYIFIKYVLKAIWWNITHKKDSQVLGITF